jgi:hypothetical protein
MQTNIIVKLQVEGTHNWPTASDFEPTMKRILNENTISKSTIL